MSVGLFVGLLDHVRLPGTTAEWIGTWLGMVVGWGFVLAYKILVVIVEGEAAVLGVSLGHCMVANGKFDGWLCGSGCGSEDVAWGGESG